jgi:hypothetical protein
VSDYRVLAWPPRANIGEAWALPRIVQARLQGQTLKKTAVNSACL